MSQLGQNSDLGVFLNDVRSTPTNGHRVARTPRPKSARNGSEATRAYGSAISVDRARRKVRFGYKREAACPDH
jgi:hypothetical protein